MGQIESINFESHCDVINNNDKSSADVSSVRDVIGNLRELKLDSTEYGCLKAIALFKPGTVAL